MHRLPRRVMGLVAACAVAFSAVPAGATPQQVVDDYLEDGLIDGTYDTADLVNAPALLTSDPAYGDFVSAIEDRVFLQLWGVQPQTEPAGVPGDPASVSVPAWFTGVGIAAGLLAAGGAASAAYRRFRR